MLARISTDSIEKESLLQRAFQIRLRLTEEFPRNPEHWEELVRAHSNLNRLLTAVGRAHEAESLADDLADAHERYLNIIGERLVPGVPDFADGDSPTGPESSEQADLVEAYVTRADELRKAGNPLRALPVYVEAADMIYQSLIESPDDPSLQRSLALISYCRSTALLDLDRTAEALEHSTAAIDQLTALTTKVPNVEVHWLRLIGCWKHRALILLQRQQTDDAWEATVKSLQFSREVTVRFPEQDSRRIDLANALKNAADTAGDAGKVAVADELLTEGTDVCRRLLESSPNRRSWRKILARLLLDRGALRCGIGDCEQGFSDLRNAVVMAESLLQEKSLYEPAWCHAANDLAWQLLVCSDESFRNPTEAFRLAQQVVQRRPADDDYQNTLGVAQYRLNQLKEARQTLDQAVLLNGGDALDYYALAMVHWKRNEPQKASKYMDLAAIWCREHESSDEGLIILREEAEQLLKEMPATGSTPAE